MPPIPAAGRQTDERKTLPVTGELVSEAVVAINATTAADGKTYQVNYYNLDAIISVGHRANSKHGTQFRIWATTVLKDHLVRGNGVRFYRRQPHRVYPGA